MTKKTIQKLIDDKATRLVRSHIGYTLINVIEQIFRFIGCFGPKGKKQTKEVSVEVNIIPLDWIVEHDA